MTSMKNQQQQRKQKQQQQQQQQQQQPRMRGALQTSWMYMYVAASLSLLSVSIQYHEAQSFCFQSPYSYLKKEHQNQQYNHPYQHQHKYQYYQFSTPSCLQQSSSSSSQENHSNHENSNSNSNNNSIELNYLDNSRLYSDQRPKRLVRKKKRKKEGTKSLSSSISTSSQQSHLTPKEKKLTKWGVRRHKINDNNNDNNDNDNRKGKYNDYSNNQNSYNCPSTVNSVAQDAFHAISSTLYCRNFLDPNIASNAMAVSVNDKRPVGFAFWPKGRDVGRLGVEIDHARFLIGDHCFGAGSSSSDGSNSTARKKQYAEIEGRALRRVVLLLASKLSQMPWSGLETTDGDSKEEDGDDNNVEKDRKDIDTLNQHEPKRTGTRPIAIFFNTLHQALQASRELKLLQQVAISQNLDVSSYKNIRILCLGQDTIPNDMLRSGRAKGKREKDKNGKTRRKWGSSRELSSGKVDPKNGLVIVVQPTDYNFELKPPSPSIGTIQELQKLLSRASVNQLPSIVVSPRLTEQFEGRAGAEQSGYQQSSTYGGVEPPRGPTPWLLRDFIPPVYSWVGCALELSSRRPSPIAVESLTTDEERKHGGGHRDIDVEYSYYSRMAMTQTVMESGHPWHVFAVKNNVHISSDAPEERNIVYQHVATTNPHSGRPSQDLLRDVLSDHDQ